MKTKSKLGRNRTFIAIIIPILILIVYLASRLKRKKYMK